MFSLQNKVVVVTGGSGVLGSAICRGAARAGATVVILARSEDKLDALAQSMTSEGLSVSTFSADVLDASALAQVRDEILNQFGRIDVLINAAGGNHGKATTRPNESSFFDLPQDAIQWVFDLNVMGTWLPTQVFGKVMAQQGHGVILNVSSMASLQPLTRVAAYGAAKAAINNFTQWLAVHMAQEYSPHIRVNAIAPGFFLGEQNRYLLIDEETGEWTARGKTIVDHTPMNRLGDPDDLVGTVLWLISNASRFVTGIVVPVDGGFSAFSGV